MVKMMGREVRMVPKDWEHPKRDNGRYIALFDSDFEEDAAAWDKECADWDAGIYPGYAKEEHKKMSFKEWDSDRPEAKDYMPIFPKGTADHYMMYETCSEGTPISPAFDTPESLAMWLESSGASSFGDQTASYEGWLRVAKGGFACSAVISHGVLKSGVD